MSRHDGDDCFDCLLVRPRRRGLEDIQALGLGGHIGELGAAGIDLLLQALEANLELGDLGQGLRVTLGARECSGELGLDRGELTAELQDTLLGQTGADGRVLLGGRSLGRGGRSGEEAGSENRGDDDRKALTGDRARGATSRGSFWFFIRIIIGGLGLFLGLDASASNQSGCGSAGRGRLRVTVFLHGGGRRVATAECPGHEPDHQSECGDEHDPPIVGLRGGGRGFRNDRRGGGRGAGRRGGRGRRIGAGGLAGRGGRGLEGGLGRETLSQHLGRERIRQLRGHVGRAAVDDTGRGRRLGRSHHGEEVDANESDEHSRGKTTGGRIGHKILHAFRAMVTGHRKRKVLRERSGTTG